MTLAYTYHPRPKHDRKLEDFPIVLALAMWRHGKTQRDVARTARRSVATVRYIWLGLGLRWQDRPPCAKS